MFNAISLIPAALDNEALCCQSDSACCDPADDPGGVWEISASNECARSAPTPRADGKVVGKDLGRAAPLKNMRRRVGNAACQCPELDLNEFGLNSSHRRCLSL